MDGFVNLTGLMNLASLWLAVAVRFLPKGIW
jgi:hypothetical protein